MEAGSLNSSTKSILPGHAPMFSHPARRGRPARSGTSFFRGDTMVRPVSTRSQRNRTRIAQVAARLIAEHGLTDWSSAKRKACRQLGLPPDEALPANDDIEQALREYNSLFQPAAQAASLHAQRAEALR